MHSLIAISCHTHTGLAAIVPLMGLMYTSKHTHSQTMRAGLFAAFTGLSGMSMAPMLKMALMINPMVVPQVGKKMGGGGLKRAVFG